MSEPQTYSLAELAKVTGLSKFVIRHWVRRRLLPATVPRGPNTRYDDAHRLRIKLMLAYMGEGMHAFEAAQRIRALPDYPALLVAAGEAPPPPAPAAVVVAAPGAVQEPARKDVGYHAALAHARQHELWEHVPLCPGVELRVRLDADTEARRVAREIEETFGGSSGKAPG